MMNKKQRLRCELNTGLNKLYSFLIKNISPLLSENPKFDECAEKIKLYKKIEEQQDEINGLKYDLDCLEKKGDPEQILKKCIAPFLSKLKERIINLEEKDENVEELKFLRANYEIFVRNLEDQGVTLFYSNEGDCLNYDKHEVVERVTTEEKKNR